MRLDYGIVPVQPAISIYCVPATSRFQFCQDLLRVSSTSSTLGMEGTGECRAKRRTPYQIVKILPSDSERVINFLRRFFFRDEPLNICVGLLDQNPTCMELESYCLESIPEGVSVMAVSEEDQILGVCLSGIVAKTLTEGQQSKDDSLEDCANPKFKKILNLLTTVSKECDLFARYPEIDSYLEIRVVSVDDSYRGQGIAKALFDKSKNLAKEFNLSMVRVDCTSHYSAMAVARLGFKSIYVLNYSEHLDDQGAPVFVPEPPHSCVKTFITHLDS